MSYYVGDIPADAIILDPPETITLDDWDAVDADIISPTGIDTAIPASLDPIQGLIILDPPDDESLFGVDGIHRIRVTLTSDGGYRQRIPDVSLVVQRPDADVWHTLDSVREEWPDAEYIDDVPLWRVLELARTQVLDFAPALVDPDIVPDRYRDAQRVQARNIWNAAKVSPDGTVGTDDFVIRPFPLDWHVKQIIRPKRGRGAVA